MKVWPEYLPNPDRETKLTPAILRDNKVITKDDEYVVRNWREIRKTIIAAQLILFVDTLTDSRRFPYMAEIRATKGCRIHETTEWVKVSISENNRKFWIIPASQWGWKYANTDFLQFIESLYVHCMAVGGTPQQLGKKLLLLSWSEHNKEYERRLILDTDWPAQYEDDTYSKPKRRHPLPPKSARMLIKDNLHGGRVQNFMEREQLPSYCKLDQDNALLSHFGI